jgi:ABC-type amino acid transport substrate-binding protein
MRERYSRTLILVTLFILLWFLPDVVDLLTRRPDEAWARVKASGAIRFATDASYPPFEGVGGDGVFYGLDIDLAREVAKRIGVTAEFTNVGVDGLYDALRVGQADASISALPIDPARAGKWVYSRPYFDAGLALVTQAGETGLEVEGLSGRVIAVALGGEGDAWLRRQQRRAAGIEAVRFDSELDALQAVAAGQADAAIVDGVTARQLLPDLHGLAVAAKLTDVPYAIALWGTSVELQAAVNRALEAMQADDTLDRIVETWMIK